MTDDNKRIGGSRFILGEQPGGFAAQMALKDGRVTALITADRSKEGPPEHIHGGALATMIDEVMGAAAWAAGYKVLAANLNISYRRPAPLAVPLTVTGWVERTQGRKVFTAGQIALPDGTVTTTGTGLFVVATHIFGDADYTQLATDDEDSSN